MKLLNIKEKGTGHKAAFIPMMITVICERDGVTEIHLINGRTVYLDVPYEATKDRWRMLLNEGF